MITGPDIAHWRGVVPWPTNPQVAQDLVLSRLIIEIANDPLLGDELVFRGGTCFHKLWLDRPWRYSEDLDYVRRSEGGVGPILDALREIAERLGFDRVQTDVRQHPKARLDVTLFDGTRLRIKIEMNTFERSPARETVTRRAAMESPWFTGEADVSTFVVEELTATKIRALYQRRKGRDLFDLWLAVEHAEVDPAEIAACFAPYRPESWTPAKAIENLELKLEDGPFREDLTPLVAQWPAGYSIDAAADVARRVIETIGD